MLYIQSSKAFQSHISCILVQLTFLQVLGALQWCSKPHHEKYMSMHEVICIGSTNDPYKEQNNDVLESKSG